MSRGRVPKRTLRPHTAWRPLAVSPLAPPTSPCHGPLSIATRLFSGPYTPIQVAITEHSCAARGACPDWRQLLLQKSAPPVSASIGTAQVSLLYTLPSTITIMPLPQQYALPIISCSLLFRPI